MKSNNNIYHYIYKIVNTINNKYYYGVHSTDDLNDGYMGSGTHVRNAIKKYGKKNFRKYIICFTNKEESAYDIEKLIVNEEMIKRKDCYNKVIGGHGGDTISYLSKEKKEEIINKRKKTNDNKTKEEKEIWRNKIKQNHMDVKGSNNPRYIHLTKEQESFIIKKNKEGIAPYKIPKYFFETFNIKINKSIFYKVLRDVFI
jgi:hypothetical protein